MGLFVFADSLFHDLSQGLSSDFAVGETLGEWIDWPTCEGSIATQNIT